MKTTDNLWMQKAMPEPGQLSKKLGIPIEMNIPFGLLRDIKSADVGKTVANRFGIGKTTIKITPEIKKEAGLALTYKEITRKRFGEKRTGYSGGKKR